MRRALVVANKWWEADPLVAVLSSARTCVPSCRFASAGASGGLRGTIDGARGRVEVWCLQELMRADASGSSTQEKACVLPDLLSDEDIALVLAFGTASTPTEESHNGCVAIGTNTFVHDPKPPKSSSRWTPPRPDTLVPSALTQAQFASLTGTDGYAARAAGLLLAPPLVPAPVLGMRLDRELVALADVNVTDYHDYAWADPAVVEAYRASGAAAPVGSLETTHGVIRAYTRDSVPFLFVSGITDRSGHFEDEVTPKKYQQNFVAAHNAGVAVALMIPSVLAFLAPD